MPDTIDKPIKAGQLPPDLRGNLDPRETVLVTVRQITPNGLTADQEAAILAAEAKTEAQPFRPAAEVLAELRTASDEA